MSDPWGWRPDPAGWFDHVAAQAVQWRPGPVVDADPRALAEQLTSAAEQRARWLWHPCADVLVDVNASDRSRDAQLAMWIGVHADEPVGQLVLDAPAHVWTGAGSCTLPAGRHDLGPARPRSDDPDELYPDVWCESTGRPLSHSWAAEPPADGEDWDRFRDGLRRLLAMQQVLAERLPAVDAWLRPVVPIVVPLRPAQGRFRSGSDPALPGLVQVDCRTSVELLEGLVHEAAHEHLFRAELPQPLTDPLDEQRYASPLRPEPRPLRGILMAFHALAYICAFYRDAVEVGLLEAPDVEQELVRLQGEAAEAGRTLQEHDLKLSPGGREFVERTGDVLAHSGR